MRRRTNCKKCGSEVFEYAQNEKTGKPEWECQNCFDRTPRQVRKSAKQRRIDRMFEASDNMKPAQNTMAKTFDNLVLDFLYRGNKSLNKANLQKFVNKEQVAGEHIITAVRLVYPSFTIKYNVDYDGQWYKGESVWSVR